LPEKAFTDGRQRAVGRDGKVLSRNSQSLLNVAFYSRYFWDGRAESLERQALIPIASPDEMNQSLDALEADLNGIKGYARQFREVFQTPVTRDGIAKAIAAFERTLVTGPSAFDRFLAGDSDALTAVAKEGLELFRGDAGCIRCHNGPLLSDSQFYRLGVAFLDKGRGAVTGQATDDFKFRTPSLRNIALTAPYMHDGSSQSLIEVVMFYFRGVPHSGPDRPLDVEPLTAQSFSDMQAIVAFLESLTGSLPDVEPPVLPVDWQTRRGRRSVAIGPSCLSRKRRPAR
jgi:cytochrome c peroxidase